MREGAAVDSVNTQRAERHLSLWASWMRSSGLRKLWYGAHSLCGAHSNAGSDFDEMADSAESEAAKMTDSIVRSLPAEQSAALHHKWLRSAYRYPDHYQTTLEAATEAVGRALHTRYGLP